MKKLFVSSIFSFFLAFPALCQSAYQQSDLMANVGIGLGSSLYGTVSINGSVEYFISDEFSLGGALGYASYGYNYDFILDDFRISVLYFGPRGSYHLSEALGVDSDHLDLYAGAFLGFAVVSASALGGRVTGFTGGPGAFTYSVFAGGRYQFNNRFAAYGELGFGISVFQLGGSIRF